MSWARALWNAPALAQPELGVDGLVAVGVLHARQLRGDQVERLVPRHRDERLDAAPGAVALHAVLEPALAHHRLVDPALCVHGARHGLDDAAGARILGEGPDPDDATVLDLGVVQAPVRAGVNQSSLASAAHRRGLLTEPARSAGRQILSGGSDVRVDASSLPLDAVALAEGW